MTKFSGNVLRIRDILHNVVNSLNQNHLNRKLFIEPFLNGSKSTNYHATYLIPPPPFPFSLPDINLKALDRAEGPVQRFRALLTTLINRLTPPPKKKHT